MFSLSEYFTSVKSFRRHSAFLYNIIKNNACKKNKKKKLKIKDHRNKSALQDVFIAVISIPVSCQRRLNERENTKRRIRL